ncbi:transcription factor TFIIA complex subunit Toa1 [Histoplasma capsulatum G186AR]|uniref:Transcription factor TFIIA complex subunit Toa1 n=1 Tax=Ajellomyces capsulatus TaxID=5037 RepID=A0A8H7YVU7_AJECA|nr:transcription factor TFIIA complex subunit Toa1 [Histoplasma capsulatum]QSS73170.1 transcription factor TFIIA complex subunit Toa1 [Histoplasma capsulatum G186AR]
MSNQQVGVVFDKVIQEVCDSSQIDFEEGGVDQQTLEDLRKGWRKKLSSLGVAHFPWDPAPQPAPAPPQQVPQPPPPQQAQGPAPIPPPPTTVPSNGPGTTPPPQPRPQQQPQFSQQPSQPHQQTPSQQFSQVPTRAPEPSAGNVRIKTEGGYQPTIQGQPPVNPSTLAQQRAANALHQRYGAAAANQVHQLQAQSQAAALSLPGAQKVPNRPGPFPQDQKPPLQQPQQYQNPAQQQPLQQLQQLQHQQRPQVNNSQTDGSSDSLQEWKAEVARRREAAEKCNKNNSGGDDHFIRSYVESRGLQLEAGGLLVPLNEQPSIAKGTKRKAHMMNDPSSSTSPAMPSTSSNSSVATSSALAQYDGVDNYNGNTGREEADEDAINSDLDDSEDMLDDSNDGDDAVGQVMLCTYDKVQRVKSKWKCTLKDGILTSGGKEYVFHKGQGEFEWY